MQQCGIEELEAALKKMDECQFADVREPAEYEAEHISGVPSLPLSSLGEASAAGLDKDRPLYIICHSGSRAADAAGRLRELGFSDLRVLEGGLQAWLAAGRGVIRGESRVWDLQRQVRFAAGLLVLIGILLSVLLHPYWLWLAAFVGAGLVFSGLTGSCGMAMLLARMPWNRRPEQ